MIILPRNIKPRPTWSMYDRPYTSEALEASSSTTLWFRCAGNRRSYFWGRPFKTENTRSTIVCPYIKIHATDTWFDAVIGPTDANEAAVELPWIAQNGFTHARITIFTCSNLAIRYGIKATVETQVNAIVTTDSTSEVANENGMALPTPGGAWRKMFAQMYMTKHEIVYPEISSPFDLVFRIQGGIQSERVLSNIGDEEGDDDQEYYIYIPMVMIQDFIPNPEG